jgi:hypothetical protein
MQFTRRTLMQVAATTAADVTREKAPPKRHLLETRWTSEKLAQALIPREDWKPISTAAERDGWDSLPDEVRSGLVAAGEKHVGQP